MNTPREYQDWIDSFADGYAAGKGGWLMDGPPSGGGYAAGYAAGARRTIGDAGSFRRDGEAAFDAALPGWRVAVGVRFLD